MAVCGPPLISVLVLFAEKGVRRRVRQRTKLTGGLEIRIMQFTKDAAVDEVSRPL